MHDEHGRPAQQKAQHRKISCMRSEIKSVTKGIKKERSNMMSKEVCQNVPNVKKSQIHNSNRNEESSEEKEKDANNMPHRFSPPLAC